MARIIHIAQEDIDRADKALSEMESIAFSFDNVRTRLTLEEAVKRELGLEVTFDIHYPRIGQPLEVVFGIRTKGNDYELGRYMGHCYIDPTHLKKPFSFSIQNLPARVKAHAKNS